MIAAHSNQRNVHPKGPFECCGNSLSSPSTVGSMLIKSTASCILDRRAAKFYIKNWKDRTKTKLMKEILKQLRTI